MNKVQLRHALKAKGLEDMELRGNDPEAMRQVEALLGSVDDTLSDEFILNELEALAAGAAPFREVFACIARDRE